MSNHFRPQWWQSAVVAAVTVAAVALAAPTAASAATTSSPPIEQTGPGQSATLSTTQIRDIDIETAASDPTTKTFDAVAAVSNGASPQGVADYGFVLSAAGWTVTGAIKAPSDAAAKIAVFAAASCKGFNGYHGNYQPWGFQFGVNSCNTTKLISSAGLGAAGAGGVAAVLTLIGATGVGLPISTVTAAIITFGMAAINQCQAYSSNGAIWLNLLGAAVTVSCWGQ
jgi:hypothetical protein